MSSKIFKPLKIQRFKSKSKISSKLLMVIPFAIISLSLFIVPLIWVAVESILPTQSGEISLNWAFMNSFIWFKIFLSILLALTATLLCMLLAYPFSYFMTFSSSKTFKSIVIILVTAPIWTSFLVKLIGLKTFFDLCAGYSNSTYGHIFTIIGLTYIYLPFMILPIFNVMRDMPINLVFASKDLGQSGIKTFFKIIIPYTKVALFAGMTLVFLPAVTTVAVPQFLNNATDSNTIGDIIIQEGEQALISDIALARASSLSVVVSIIMILMYGAISFLPKAISNLRRKIHNKMVAI